MLDNNQKVFGIDNLSSGLKSNIDRLSSIENFHFIEGNILDFKDYQDQIEDLDIVVHLAAQGSVQKSIDDPILNNDMNVNGFLNILSVAKKNNVKKFIYASSCSVYGDTEIIPITESNNPKPMSPYATSKLINDFYADNLRDSMKPMEIFGLRFFNIFGPFQNPKGAYAAVIAKWIDDCLNGIQPIVYGDGEQTRDFCFVDNISDLIYSISENDSLKGDTYNISSNKSISLNDLFKTIRNQLLKHGIQISFDSPFYESARKGDIIHSLGSNLKAVRELDFDLKINLDDGIALILKNQYNLELDV